MLLVHPPCADMAPRHPPGARKRPRTFSPRSSCTESKWESGNTVGSANTRRKVRKITKRPVRSKNPSDPTSGKNWKMLDECHVFYKWNESLRPYIELTKQFIDAFFEDDETVEDLRLVMQMVLTTREYKSNEYCFYLKDDNTTSINGGIIGTRNCRTALAKLKKHGLVQSKEMKDKSCSDAKTAHYYWWEPCAFLHAVDTIMRKHDEKPEPKVIESAFRCPECKFSSYSVSDVALMSMKSSDYTARCLRCSKELVPFQEQAAPKRDYSAIKNLVANIKREEYRSKPTVITPAWSLKLRLKRSQLPPDETLSDGRELVYGINMWGETFKMIFGEPPPPPKKYVACLPSLHESIHETRPCREYGMFDPDLDSLFDWDTDEDEW